MTKNLILLHHRGFNLGREISEIIKEPEIYIWMQEICIGIEIDKLVNYVNKELYDFDTISFFERFHYTIKGILFSPLFGEYIKNLHLNHNINEKFPKKLSAIMSLKETKITKLLWHNIDTIVETNKLYNVIGDSEYSKLAFNQMMSRLRKN